MGVRSLILIVNLKCLKKKWFRVSKFLSHELFYVPWKAHIVTEFQLFDGFLRFHFHTLPLGTQSVQAVSVRKGLLLPKLQNKTYLYTRALGVPLKCCLYLWSEVRATRGLGSALATWIPQNLRPAGWTCHGCFAVKPDYFCKLHEKIHHQEWF